jgi:hypothetical protein
MLISESRPAFPESAPWFVDLDGAPVAPRRSAKRQAIQRTPAGA